MAKVKFTIITLFEEALRPYLEASMMWKAQDKGIVEFNFVNLRDYGLGPHKSVDDTPYGGGDGMVLRVEPIFAAVEKIKETCQKNGEIEPKVILPTPDGELWNENLARQFAKIDLPDSDVDAIETSIRGKTAEGKPLNLSNASKNSSLFSRADASLSVNKGQGNNPLIHYVIICPHYEGYDERILKLVDYKICLGPYVLTGGELPALVIIDSIVRLLKGVLGGATSADIESFSNEDINNIEAPQYTKPSDFRGMKVPDVLLSGDHKKVATWRKEHEKKTTLMPHPCLDIKSIDKNTYEWYNEMIV